MDGIRFRTGGGNSIGVYCRNREGVVKVQLRKAVRKKILTIRKRGNKDIILLVKAKVQAGPNGMNGNLGLISMKNGMGFVSGVP